MYICINLIEAGLKWFLFGFQGIETTFKSEDDHFGPSRTGWMPSYHLHVLNSSVELRWPMPEDLKWFLFGFQGFKMTFIFEDGHFPSLFVEFIGWPMPEGLHASEFICIFGDTFNISLWNYIYTSWYQKHVFWINHCSYACISLFDISCCYMFFLLQWVCTVETISDPRITCAQKV